jgi:hypothetical protein
MVNRRSFSGLLTAIAVASVIPGIVQAQDAPVAQNVVLVHGLYADGSVSAPAHDGVVPSFLQPLHKPVPMVATADIGHLAAALLQETWTGRRSPSPHAEEH